MTALTGLGDGAPSALTGGVSMPVAGGGGIADAVRALDAAGIAIGDIATRRPTLDDVFLNLTGRVAVDEQEETE
jgi:ABC-2 type transport system ATP-binding protein